MSGSDFRTRRLSKDNAYFELKQSILNETLKPDQVVNEENLASLLGISRTPLREAIQRLEIEEFLIRQPNGRLKVSSITKGEVEEIFLIRSMLEGFITKNAAKNATDSELHTLSEIQKKMRNTFKLGNSQDFVTYGFEFHDFISKISGLKKFVKILDMVRDHSLRYCRFVSIHGNWKMGADEEHDLILQKMIERDEEGAEKAMQEHILISLSTVLQQIQVLEKK